MIRHTLFIAAALCAAGTTQAQTLSVHTGEVTTVFAAASAGNMTYSDSGTALTIQGHRFAIADIDSITASPTASVEAKTVAVNYAGTTAHVTLSGDLANLLTVTATGSNVSIMASEALADEVSYVLSGESADGSFYMDGSCKASFTLNNLQLTNAHGGGAVTIDCGKRIDIHIPTGTTTTLADAAGGTHKACFFVNGHAEFKGGGTLNVSGNTKHAYASDEYTLFKPSFGTMNVTSAVSDGLHIEQYFRMDGGTLNVTGTQGDCVDVGITKDTTDELNGQIIINAGKLSLNVAADDIKGLKSDSLITFAGGTLEAEVSGLGTKGISAGTNLIISQLTETPTLVKMNVTGTTYHKGEPDESKCRGIKAKGDFTFNGGTIQMSVTGKKAKGISIDGTYRYISGSTNVLPE